MHIARPLRVFGFGFAYQPMLRQLLLALAGTGLWLMSTSELAVLFQQILSIKD